MQGSSQSRKREVCTPLCANPLALGQRGLVFLKREQTLKSFESDTFYQWRVPLEV